MTLCVHHWRYSAASGPVSVATCLHCPATREVATALDEDRPASAGRGGKMRSIIDQVWRSTGRRTAQEQP